MNNIQFPFIQPQQYNPQEIIFNIQQQILRFQKEIENISERIAILEKALQNNSLQNDDNFYIM